jgi:hypothetical protein
LVCDDIDQGGNINEKLMFDNRTITNIAGYTDDDDNERRIMEWNECENDANNGETQEGYNTN